MEKIYIYFINDETSENVKGKTPLKAAKKLWRKYKFDNKDPRPPMATFSSTDITL